jgi:hypothetical protein
VSRTHDAPSLLAPNDAPEGEATRHESAHTVAFESPAESPAPASNPLIPPIILPPPVTILPEPAQTTVAAPAAIEGPAAFEQAPAPSGPAVAEAPAPEPTSVDLREVIRSASAVATEAEPDRRPISPAMDHAFGQSPQSSAAALYRQEAEIAPVPRRAASLGIALDASAPALETEPPARRLPVAAIAIAGAAVMALAGGGWFLLSPRGPEPAASTAAPAKEAAAPVKETSLVEKLRAAAPSAQQSPACGDRLGGRTFAAATGATRRLNRDAAKHRGARPDLHAKAGGGAGSGEAGHRQS